MDSLILEICIAALRGKKGDFMKKRFFLPGIIVLLFALFTQFTFAVDSGTTNISLNNNPINAKAYVAEGNLYLPVRAICESLGYNVEWFQADQTVEITSDGTLILLNFNKSMIEVNNHDYYMTEDRITINDRIYMKADFFTENFNLSVKWDKTDGTVSLNTIKSNPISIRTIKETSEDSELKVTLQYPQIDGIENKLVQDEINALFKQLAENAAKEGAKNAAELAEYVKEHPGNPNKCETYFNYHVKYNQNNILSLVFLNYQYARGAHGSTMQTSYTIDLETGKQYSLKDLFKENSDYVSIISDGVKAKLTERNLMNVLLVPFDKIREDHSYYITNDTVVVYFQQYEILPGAAGIQEFSTDFSLLSKLFIEPDIFK